MSEQSCAREADACSHLRPAVSQTWMCPEVSLPIARCVARCPHYCCCRCHAQYRIPRSHQHLFPRELFGGALPGPRHCLHMLAAKLRSPSLVRRRNREDRNEISDFLILHLPVMGSLRIAGCGLPLEVVNNCRSMVAL